MALIWPSSVYYFKPKRNNISLNRVCLEKVGFSKTATGLAQIWAISHCWKIHLSPTSVSFFSSPVIFFSEQYFPLTQIALLPEPPQIASKTQFIFPQMSNKQRIWCGIMDRGKSMACCLWGFNIDHESQRGSSPRWLSLALPGGEVCRVCNFNGLLSLARQTDSHYCLLCFA